MQRIMDWSTLILRPSLTLGNHDAGVRYMLKCTVIDACKEFPRVEFFMLSQDKKKLNKTITLGCTYNES